MEKPIVPSDRINTNLPTFMALGLTEAESNAVYFAIVEDILPTKKTTADALLAIAEKKGWSDKQKVWAAHNLRLEILKKKGIPDLFVQQLEV